MMPAKIPWEIIGPAAAGVVVILIIVFGFMLKWQKQAKDRTLQSPPSNISNINTISKKSICFRHEREIGSNQTAIKMIGEQLEKSQEQNSEQHGKIFDKLEDLGTSIIKEIHKKNGD